MQQSFLMVGVELKCHNGAKTELVTAQSSEHGLPPCQGLPRDSWPARMSRGREVLRPGRAACAGRSRRKPRHTRGPCAPPSPQRGERSSLAFEAPQWPLNGLTSPDSPVTCHQLDVSEPQTTGAGSVRESLQCQLNRNEYWVLIFRFFIWFPAWLSLHHVWMGQVTPKTPLEHTSFFS